MDHSGWHRATIPQGHQNMPKKLVPQSCKDMNAHMNSFTHMHCPMEFSRIFPLYWLKSSSGISWFYGLKGVRRRGVFSKVATLPWPSHYIHSFWHFLSARWVQHRTLPCYLSLNALLWPPRCRNNPAVVPTVPWGPHNFISSHVQLQGFFLSSKNWCNYLVNQCMPHEMCQKVCWALSRI